MAALLDALKDGIRNAFCASISPSDNWFAQLQDLLRLRPQQEIRDRINQAFCNRPPGETPDVPPPFTGGQCPIRYRVDAEYFRYDNSCNLVGPIPLSGTFDGPIGAPFPISDPPSPDVTCPGAVGNQWLFTAGGVERPLSPGVGRGVGALSIVSVVPNPLVPDVCGDPPPVLPTPAPTEVTINVDYGDNNEFNLSVPVVFGVAYVNLDGSINVPISIGELSLFGELSLNGNFDVNLDFGPKLPPNSGDDGPDVEPDPEGGDPEDEPEDEPGLIVGVFVIVTTLPSQRSTVIPQDNGPSILAPRAASVKFKVCANDRCGWTEDFPVKSSNAWVPVPGRILATDVQVTPDFGAEVEFSVVRERPQQA